MGGWDGYAASLRHITQSWVDANVRNAVVLTGDVHRNWANDLKVDYKDPVSPMVGSELVCTSITSTGNGTGSTVDPVMAWNPHLKFYNDNRGYVNTKVTKDALKAHFRVVDYDTTLIPRQHEGLLRDPGRRAGIGRQVEPVDTFETPIRVRPDGGFAVV